MKKADIEGESIATGATNASKNKMVWAEN
jgi:hypothetical protein